MANLQGLNCWYCGEIAKTRDHKKARSRGGSCKRSNIVPACGRCNSVKSRLSVEEFRAELKKRASHNEASPHWWRIIRILAPWDFIFYGERAAANATFPQPCESRSGSRWKMRKSRPLGSQAVRIEECAKRGPFAEVQGGLMKGEPK